MASHSSKRHPCRSGVTHGVCELDVRDGAEAREISRVQHHCVASKRRSGASLDNLAQALCCVCSSTGGGEHADHSHEGPRCRGIWGSSRPRTALGLLPLQHEHKPKGRARQSTHSNHLSVRNWHAACRLRCCGNVNAALRQKGGWLLRVQPRVNVPRRPGPVCAHRDGSAGVASACARPRQRLALHRHAPGILPGGGALGARHQAQERRHPWRRKRDAASTARMAPLPAGEGDGVGHAGHGCAGHGGPVGRRVDRLPHAKVAHKSRDPGPATPWGEGHIVVAALRCVHSRERHRLCEPAGGLAWWGGG
mmetsp:Transcript_5666/g.24014  ORF Transcript_5666/g.24014 Transcript_5666/m.24014 type:complete len:308 (+) Transcript_5666:280-1203(+)